MRGRKSKLMLASVGIIAIIGTGFALASSFLFSEDSLPAPRTVGTSEACVAAEDQRGSVYVSAWAGRSAFSYADVPRLNEAPDAYQSVWMSRLQNLTGEGLNNDVASFLRSTLEADSSEKFSDPASQLYWTALSLTPGDLSSQSLQIAADALRTGGGFATTPGEGASLLASSRVALALSHHSLPVPEEVLEWMSEQLDAQGSPDLADSVSVETHATTVHALHLNNRLQSRSSFSEQLEALAKEIASSEITLEQLAPFHSIIQAHRSLSQEQITRDLRFSDDFMSFEGGWFAASGAASPDPQITFYIHSLHDDLANPDLSWGAVDGGWRSTVGPSLGASGLWAKMAYTCGFEYGGDVAAIEELARKQLVSPDVTAQMALQLAHIIRASGAAYDRNATEDSLNDMRASALSEENWLDAARTSSALTVLQLSVLDVPERVLDPSSLTSFELQAARQLLQEEGVDVSPTNVDDAVERLSRDNGFAYSLQTDMADIVSTVALADDPGRELDAFVGGRFYCETSPANASACNATLISLAAAVDAEDAAVGVWW